MSATDCGYGCKQGMKSVAYTYFKSVKEGVTVSGSGPLGGHRGGDALVEFLNEVGGNVVCCHPCVVLVAVSFPFDLVFHHAFPRPSP